MRRLLNLTISVIVCSSTCIAADGYVQMADQGVTMGVSYDGQYVFGYYDRSGVGTQSTWLYDTSTRTTSRFTNYSETNMDAGGQVMCMNSNGTAVGTMHDKDWVAPVALSAATAEPYFNYPLFSAAIWKDGNLVKLDHNQWEDIDDFVDPQGNPPLNHNGFYAVKISEDEEVITGYMRYFNDFLPVQWLKNSDGSYQSHMLDMPSGVVLKSWIGASNNGSRIVMNTQQVAGTSYVWETAANESPTPFTYISTTDNITEVNLTAISPSGRYAMMRCRRNGILTYGVYDFDTASAEWVPLPENSGSYTWFAINNITDQREGFICDGDYQLHYFNMDLGITIPVADYIAAYGSGIEGNPTEINKSLVRCLSEDGKVVCGNTLQFSAEVAGWFAKFPQETPMLFDMKNCEATFCAPGKLLLKWNEPSLPSGASVTKYILTVDGVDTELQSAETGADGKCRKILDAPLGNHTIVFSCEATDRDGNPWQSIPHQMTVKISADTSLYFFEDLDDSDIDDVAHAYIYTHDTFVSPIPLGERLLSFRLDGGDFFNPTPFWYTGSFSQGNWDTYLESRWFDASDASDFYFTWHERNYPMNNATGYAASNLLILEYTLDGETWTELNQSDGLTNGGHWVAREADLSDLAGKTFRLRFHATGIGEMPCEWRLDYYGIIDAAQKFEAPQGLMIADESDSDLTLAWKNNRGEYEPSYNYNSPMTYTHNIGNEGSDLYVACDYGSAKLKGFEGKYITSVATMLYEPPTAGQDFHTTVDAMVFDSEGNILSSGRLPADAPWYSGDGFDIPIHHIILDNAVKIETGKTYRVAIKISNYMPEMCPIWYYSASDDYIPGVTDLYSDDNLQSWGTISSLYDPSNLEIFNEYGRCIFNIRPCISDTDQISSLPYEQKQWFYQVYSSGQPLADGISFHTQMSAKAPKADNSSFTVQAFRRDGKVSEMSAPLVYNPSSVESFTDETEPVISVIADGDLLKVIGSFDSVAIYDCKGILVSRSAILNVNETGHGFYIVVVNINGKNISKKVII